MQFDRPVEQILGIGALVLLGIGCLAVLWPFLSALLWAAVLCFSTWPAYTWFERTLGGRRTLAALLMTLLVALVLVAPFASQWQRWLIACRASLPRQIVSLSKVLLRRQPGWRDSRSLASAWPFTGKVWHTTLRLFSSN